MKKVLAIALATAGFAMAGEGEALFKSKGCAGCHQPDKDTVGPSLKKIAQAYQSVEQLVKYLKGEAQPIVDPAKASMMNPQLNALKGLSEEQLKAIAEYILSHK